MTVETIIENNRHFCIVSAGRERMRSFLRIDLIDESGITEERSRLRTSKWTLNGVNLMDTAMEVTGGGTGRPCSDG